MTPLEDDAPVAVTEQVRYPALVVREWVSGELLTLPMLPDIDLAQIPESQLVELLADYLGRDLDRLTRSALHDQLRAKARQIAKQLQQPKGGSDA